MSYRLAPLALDDLSGIADFLAEEYPSVAPRVELELRRLFSLVAEFPKIGRPGSVPGTRELAVRRYPYLIVFEQEADHVAILRVFHTARDPETK